MNKHFLSIAELTRDEIFEVFDLTRELKEKTNRGEAHHLLKGKTLAMIFAKPSARTRISFEVGMFQLGGHALYLSPNDIGIGTREAVKDVARVLSRYNDGIMARLFGHANIVELAEYSTVPVINGLTDLLHPCQVMADAFTILEHRTTLENMKVAFIGDGNNVANSWINFASRVSMRLALAVPDGYDPDADILSRAQKTGLSEITIHRDPGEAVKNADVVYTDVWASMGQETEAEKRKKIFQPYQVNEQLMKSARSDTYFMHCLPAHRNEEVTDSVIESSNSLVFDEAENRMHVQKAIMVKLMQDK